MKEKGYNVGFIATTVAFLSLSLLFFLPIIVRNHWVTSIVAFILGSASFLILVTTIGRTLIKKRPITRKLIYIFIISVFAQIVSVGLFANVVIDFLVRGYNPI
ncbi:hypothetical protein [Porphyromonas circumdentaria]|uniref:Uncharacterized protein n=1 Tax=Porphyromonas circumdentaria TaxID=29524 RepID=A0A1T4NUI0_9PORP|nr:hypothetical protein [Porphyromonas circumdentaria]MBB6276188.1 hypothetical protein [Porphyromonas circumdentaria]MDO4722325.1 hypothetical protein [Porphyromonas circumdentaria]SJZ82398.1 hypothetical protein SAMN02745171_01220 [Porphyromonas circumdentaria]